uniref:Uncharacterized protein n=1 Tax=Sphaerodactylus townsendi TaxID=933632 RepID=A0ACB8FUF5_9SAUR
MALCGAGGAAATCQVPTPCAWPGFPTAQPSARGLPANTVATGQRPSAAAAAVVHPACGPSGEKVSPSDALFATSCFLHRLGGPSAGFGHCRPSPPLRLLPHRSSPAAAAVAEGMPGRLESPGNGLPYINTHSCRAHSLGHDEGYFARRPLPRSCLKHRRDLQLGAPFQRKRCCSLV